MLFVTQQVIILCVHNMLFVTQQVIMLCVHDVCAGDQAVCTGDHAVCSCCVYR